MHEQRRSGKKRVAMILLSVILCGALGMIGWMIYGKAQMAKVPGLVFRDAVLNRVKGLNMNGDHDGFAYSNFGYAVLGLVLESVYKGKK